MGYVRAVLRIESIDRRYLESIYRSLEPDNVNPPRDVKIEGRLEDNSYLFMVETILRSRKFDSLRGTLDEVLSLIEAIDNVLTMLK